MNANMRMKKEWINENMIRKGWWTEEKKGKKKKRMNEWKTAEDELLWRRNM